MDITNQFDVAMQRIRELAGTKSQSSGGLRLALAFSGGLDSAVLLRLCSAWARQHQVYLVALHVHHGLSANADHWAQHCQEQCAQQQVQYEVAHIQLGATGEDGVEATARSKRYAALGVLCAKHQIDVLLTAHHQDDQAETILLQLLRGSGVAGLCGMQQCHQADQLLGSTSLLLARPLLDVMRSELEHYATNNTVLHIDDESNQDPRYLRNALRLKVMPLLAEYFPGYQTRLGRSAQHAQSSLELLEQLAHHDFQQCLISPESAILDATRLEALPDARIDHVLRFWIAAHHRKMPSSARLAEIRKQLMTAKNDARVTVKHGDLELHRYRQHLSIATFVSQPPSAQEFVWSGEASMAFPAFAGTLTVTRAEGEPGIRRGWLMEKKLAIRLRQGGERLKLAANRPTRDMKSHYQTLGIPYWQRERLPFVFAGRALLFAAGVGVHGPFLELGDDCVKLNWVPD